MLLEYFSDKLLKILDAVDSPPKVAILWNEFESPFSFEVWLSGSNSDCFMTVLLFRPRAQEVNFNIISTSINLAFE